MFETSTTSKRTGFSGLPSAVQPNILAKLIADAMATLERDRVSALTLLQQAMTLLQPSDVTNDPAEAQTEPRPSLAPWQVKRVNDHIHAHLHGRITLSDLAGVARLSNSHFSRAFKGAFGQTPHAFIMCARVELASRKMIDSDAPLSHIALSCGFADQAHLTRLFRCKIGLAPHQWRRAHQSAPQ